MFFIAGFGLPVVLLGRRTLLSIHKDGASFKKKMKRILGFRLAGYGIALIFLISYAATDNSIIGNLARSYINAESIIRTTFE